LAEGGRSVQAAQSYFSPDVAEPGLRGPFKTKGPEKPKESYELSGDAHTIMAANIPDRDVGAARGEERNRAGKEPAGRGGSCDSLLEKQEKIAKVLGHNPSVDELRAIDHYLQVYDECRGKKNWGWHCNQARAETYVYSGVKSFDQWSGSDLMK